MHITGIIPARYQSSRFPGKPLADIGGKTMIQRVYEQALQATLLNTVIVATDDQRIADAVQGFNGNVVFTSSNHQNGTERCAEVADKIATDVIINIQGDEPFIQPAAIDDLAKVFVQKPNTEIATLIQPHALDNDLATPERIKVTVNKHLEALFFSRSLIPHRYQANDATDCTYYKHIGLYGYAKHVLLDIVRLPPSMLELNERLEQLRWLENGYRIQCCLTEHDSYPVDTPADLELIRNKITFSK